MRLLLAAMALAFLVQTPSKAQNCETLSVRDVAGRITATKLICVDANGAWADPATINAASEPVVETSAPLPLAKTEIIPEADAKRTPCPHNRRTSEPRGRAIACG